MFLSIREGWTITVDKRMDPQCHSEALTLHDIKTEITVCIHVFFDSSLHCSIIRNGS